MFQVPVHIWQAIAKAHPEMLDSRWGQAMAGGQPAIDRLLAEVAKETPPDLTVPFELVAPLLTETRAIQTYLRETDAYDLMQALPDVGTPQDAAALAAAEYRLTPKETNSLESLLSQELDKIAD